MKVPFLAWRPQYIEPPDPPEEIPVAVKTLSVVAAITQNPANAPTPQAIMAAVSQALSDPVFATASPWTAIVTITSS